MPPSTLSAAPIAAFRGSFVDFVADPFFYPESESVRYFPDGLLIVEQGRVTALAPYEELKAIGETVPIQHYPGKLITPGFLDIHTHLPQTGMIAAYGEQLLEWLDKYTFPTERRFQDKDYARAVTTVFLEELLRNGTTTAVVLAAVFPASVEAFFEAADRLNLRMIAGKVMMDRNAPDFLRDTATSSYAESKALIEQWHHRGRSQYAITPRFAPTSTPEQLQAVAQLLQEYPDTYLHTHLSENVNEVAWVKELFPDCQGYLDVYDRAGLVGQRSIFAHCIQLTDAEFRRLSEAGSTIAFCPTSNLFLGSGLFKLAQAKSPDWPIAVALATDVGAGTSFSMLQTAAAAYQVAQLQNQRLSPFQALYLITLGAARSLQLEDKIGSFAIGREADFVVLDPQATPIMAFRNPHPTAETIADLADLLFSLIIMGDDRAVTATYIMGTLAYASPRTGFL